LNKATDQPPKHAYEGGSKAGARLFDADRTDREIELGPDTVASVSDRQLLWVDLTLSGERGESPIPLEWLPFDRAELESAWSSAPHPRLAVHGDYFLARLLVLRAKKNSYVADSLDVVVGTNVVLTAHLNPIPFLAELNDRITGDTNLGEIDAVDFASVLVDGVFTTYLELTDTILATVDELDGVALESQGDRDLLSELVDLRHRIATIRRSLAAHRTVVAALSGAAFAEVTGKEAGPRFAGTAEHFDAAVDAIDAAREALLGTFTIHMSRTAQRTNDVVKVLTIASVLLLPTAVIAGFMGMNIQAPYSNDNPAIFWIVVVLIVTLAIGTLVALRSRRWL
jgi:magnesium transporter